jgi:hypothetical protein
MRSGLLECDLYGGMAKEGFDWIWCEPASYPKFILYNKRDKATSIACIGSRQLGMYCPSVHDKLEALKTAQSAQRVRRMTDGGHDCNHPAR